MRCCRPVEHLCTRLPWNLQAGNWLCVVRLSLAARRRRGRRISGQSEECHKGGGGERVDVECEWKVSGLGMQYRMV
ncbi:hypothetical protein CUC08_Gglean011513 [Alternaria sp. MG1]|nr:hypothetical protein CUC08_Gglean011513 [Alternaria sp. MG1]